MIECEKIVEHSDRDLNDALIVIAIYAFFALTLLCEIFVGIGSLVRLL